MLNTDSNKDCFLKDLSILWAFPVLAPVIMLLASFLFSTWTWGLMDDPGFVQTVGQGSFLERSWSFFQSLAGLGSFRPTYAYYVNLFYKIFMSHPVGFYIFRLFFSMATLFLWGDCARLITKKRIALFLVPTIVLSFSDFYTVFFYLSAQEILGLFFAGLAFRFFLIGMVLPVFQDQGLRFGQIFGAVLSLLFMLGSKEVFVSSLFCLGLLSGTIFFVKKNRAMLYVGLGMMAVAIGYAVFLKTVVQGGYSSGYHFGDFEKILNNLFLWFKSSWLHHTVWLFLGGGAVLLNRSKSGFSSISKLEFLSFLFGLALYGSFLLLSLPWQATSHYAPPLGVFFAFMLSVILARYMDNLSRGLFLVMVFSTLIFNVFVASERIVNMEGYQRDTVQLTKWTSTNLLFQYDIAKGADVAGNAIEPGDKLSALTKILYNAEIPKFSFVPNVGELIRNKDIVYYLYGTSWGDQNLLRLPQMFSPVFMSENWIMFRRMR